MDHNAHQRPLGSDLLFNYQFLESSSWKFVEHTLIPPACLPEPLLHVGSAFVVHSHDMWILKGAVRAGCFLNMQRLKQVCNSLEIKPSKGTGKNGALKKIDWATTLTNRLWPGASQEIKTQCIAGLCGWTTQKTDLSVLAMAAEMDVENQDAFKKLKQNAERTLEETIFGKGRTSATKKLAAKPATESPEAEAAAKAKAKKTDEVKMAKAKQKEEREKQKEANRLYDLTPAELKKLLPGAGAVTGCFWMRFHPIKKFWRADYPIGVLNAVQGFDFQFPFTVIDV